GCGSAAALGLTLRIPAPSRPALLAEHRATTGVAVEIRPTGEESSMVRTILAAGSIASVLLVGLPAEAQQQSPSPDQSAPQEGARSLVGLSVYSSDGRKLGTISEVGRVRGELAVRAEVGQLLGIGSSMVIIPERTFQRKTDRIELAM